MPPQLKASGANQQSKSQNAVLMPSAKPTVIPPHLRGFNHPPRAGQSSSYSNLPHLRPAAPHLQAAPSQVGPSHLQVGHPHLAEFQHVQNAPSHLQARPPQLPAGTIPLQTMPVFVNAWQPTPIKTPYSNNSTADKNLQSDQIQSSPLSQGARYLSHSIQSVATPPANLQKDQTPSDAHPASKTEPASFLSYMNDKMTAKIEAKKKEIAEKAILPPPDPAAARAARYNVFAAPNEKSDIVFKSFIADQLKSPVTNGKKYTFTGGQQAQQQVSISPKHGGDHRPALQTPKSSRHVSSSLVRNEIDPHAAFSPGDRTNISPIMK